MAQAPRSGAGNNRRLLLIGGSVGAVLIVACCGGFGMVAYFGNRVEKTTRAELAEADSLWDKGSKDAAAAKYRAIINDRRVTFVKADDRPRLYGRLIDAEFEAGNGDAAKMLLDEAAKHNTTPATSHPDAKRVVSGKAATAPEKGKSRDDVIELCAATAVVVAAKDNNGANTGLEEFTDLMRSAAKELGADKHEDTRPLLQIKPTSLKEFTTPEGVRGVVLRYSPRTTASFSKNPMTGWWPTFVARPGMPATRPPTTHDQSARRPSPGFSGATGRRHPAPGASPPASRSCS